MKTLAILASGPSLTADDVELVKLAEVPTMVINTTFRMAPWADYLYTNDDDWLDWHLTELGATFNGQIWCGHADYAHVDGVHHVPFDRDCDGLAHKPGHISWGMNSGGAALSLAEMLGYQRLILLGYDQQWQGDRPRWHGKHPEHLQNRKPGFHRWREYFERVAQQAPARELEIINCSRETSLTCFRREPLRSMLKW